MCEFCPSGLGIGGEVPVCAVCGSEAELEVHRHAFAASQSQYDATGHSDAEALAKPISARSSLQFLLVFANGDSAFRMRKRKSMGRAGHQVAWCDTVAAALLALRQGTFDLIALDPVLPDTCRRDLLQALRREGAPTPAIMMTGLDDPALFSRH